jgi:hypothetical protein
LRKVTTLDIDAGRTYKHVTVVAGKRDLGVAQDGASFRRTPAE